MEISRRGFLRATTVAAGLAAVPITPSLSEAAVRGAAPVTTAKQTLVPGTPNALGYSKIVVGPAESRLVLTGLGTAAASNRADLREPLLAFAQFSDTHVVDHQSPGRVEWVDRYDDPSSVPTTGLFNAAYRPHEMLSAQVLDSMVQAVNNQKVGPATDLPLSFVIETGDNSDNSQYNEVRWNIDILDGGSAVQSDSGDLSRYEGVMDQDALTYDGNYWHPDGQPLLRQVDEYRSVHGFPTVPGILDAARRPFQPAGLQIPWYSCFGNHDGLMQGNFPAATTQFGKIATGPVKIISPPAGVTAATVQNAATTGSLPTLIAGVPVGPGVRLVTPDGHRRPLSRGEYVAEHFTTTGSPMGHGFTAANQSAGTAYYSWERGHFRFIVMDTVNPNGYADGSLDSAQYAWLQNEVTSAAGKAVIIFSHHTSATMGNPLLGTGGDTSQRVLGDTVTAFLLTQPRVIAWVNGHTHRNEIIAHPVAAGGGFWEINTASHIDFPQQARIIEVADNADGTWSIFTTIIDHAAPADSGGRTDTPLALASWSRELAANDPQNNRAAHTGAAKDRNTELLVPAPLDVPTPH